MSVHSAGLVVDVPSFQFNQYVCDWLQFTPETDPELVPVFQAGRRFLLRAEAKLGKCGLWATHNAPLKERLSTSARIYDKYHSSYCASIGLIDYSFAGDRAKPSAPLAICAAPPAASHQEQQQDQDQDANTGAIVQAAVAAVVDSVVGIENLFEKEEDLRNFVPARGAVGTKPIEVKKTTDPNKSKWKHFVLLEVCEFVGMNILCLYSCYGDSWHEGTRWLGNLRGLAAL